MGLHKPRVDRRNNRLEIEGVKRLYYPLSSRENVCFDIAQVPLDTLSLSGTSLFPVDDIFFTPNTQPSNSSEAT